MPAIQMSNVSVVYKGSKESALDQITLEVEEGEMLLLLGRNNSGKSTFCRLLNGLVPHSIPSTLTGAAAVFGKDISRGKVASLSTSVGMVFQEPESQLFCMSAEEEIAFGPENIAVPRAEIVSRVEWALDIVGLRGYNSRSPASLSGGEMQRLAIAAALSMHPRMMVLDEPAYALDPVGREELYSLLRRLKERFGMTVIIAEHGAEEAIQFCDRVVVLAKGRVLADGSPRDILSDETLFDFAGVSAPQLSRLSSIMRRRSLGTGSSIHTIDDAVREVQDAISTGGQEVPR
ncbi:MAG: ATP-binding cassette domain-containing protein [Methanobacteriota archaeon]|nr:MAG: ATP-binding cassette domain-containing protein [Euryarchaeota archaeon]